MLYEKPKNAKLNTNTYVLILILMEYALWDVANISNEFGELS